MRDITLRALDILGSVDLVLAEDTRVAAKLLSAYGLSPPVRPYHDHNGEKVRPGVLRALEDGQRIALISDAGTPLVSDPGFKLARDAIEQGSDVIPVPGASALLAGLAGAGLATDQFLFAGFPPAKQGARRRWLDALANVRATLIMYEGPSRLADSLADMADILGKRDAVLARELTKKFETFRRMSLDDLADAVREEGPPRGEIVLLVGPPGETQTDAASLDEALRAALQDASVKDAASDVATRLGLKKRDVYNRALELKNDDAD